MVTLSKRATPAQRRVLRIVEGAVLNAADAHRQPRDERLARSIAKRAAGTLTAAWPEVLAAHAVSSDKAEGESRAITRPRRAPPRMAPERGPALFLGRRAPLRRLWKALAWRVGEAKRAGQLDRADVLIEVLRLIAAEQHGINSRYQVTTASH